MFFSESFFDSLKNNDSSQKIQEKKKNFGENSLRNSHIRHKSQNMDRKRNNMNNFGNFEFLREKNDEEELKINEFHQNQRIPHNLEQHQENISNEHLENQDFNVDNLMQILYDERIFEQNRIKNKEKEGASQVQINRLPERKIDLEFVKSHYNIDQDCITMNFYWVLGNLNEG